MVVRSGRAFGLGVILGTVLMGCVGATFNYKWYYPNLTSYDGTLLGSTPQDDLSASVCEIDPNTHEHGCVVMLKKDFQALYTDLLDTKNRLISCEQSKK